MLEDLITQYPNFFIVFIIFLGLCLGSFSSALSYRVPRGMPWAWQKNAATNNKFHAIRSICPKCETILQAHDLIPLVSWVTTGGKCRYCKASISKRYPFQELLFAGVAVLIWIMMGGRYPYMALGGIISTPFIYTFILSHQKYGKISDQMLLIIITIATISCAFTVF